MKKINNLKDGDLLWFRLTYKDNGLTKEVRRISVKHVLQDSDRVSLMTGFRQSFIRLIEMDGASKIHYGPSEGESNRYYCTNIYGEGMYYYTEKEALLEDLRTEKSRICERIDGFIAQIK